MNGKEDEFFIEKVTIGSIMNHFNLGNHTVETLNKVLTLKREKLDASGNYLKGIRSFANKEHLTVSENIVKEQIKECNVLEYHIAKLLKLSEANDG